MSNLGSNPWNEFEALAQAPSFVENGDFGVAVELLCSFPLLEACIRAEEHYVLLRQLLNIRTSLSTDDPLWSRVSDYCCFIRSMGSVAANNPDIVMSAALNERADSQVRLDAEKHIASKPGETKELHALASKQSRRTFRWESVHLWEHTLPPTPREQHLTTLLLQEAVPAIAVQPGHPSGGRMIAICSGPKVGLFDASVRDCLRILHGPDRRFVLALCFSPNGKRLAVATSDGVMRVWDVFYGTVIQTYNLRAGRHHDGVATSAKFSTDGRWIAVGTKWTEQIWDTSSCDLHRYHSNFASARLRRREKVIAGFSHNDTAVVSICGELAFYVWCFLDKDSPVRVPVESARKDDRIVCACVTADGQRVAFATRDGDIQLWDLGSLLCTRVLPCHGWDVLALTCSADGGWIAAGCRFGRLLVYPLLRGGASVSDNTAAHVTDASRGCNGVGVCSGVSRPSMPVSDDVTVYMLHGGRGDIRTLSFGVESGILVTGSDEGAVHVWDRPAFDPPTGTASRIVRGYPDGGSNLCVTVSPCGRTVAAGSSDRGVRLWGIGHQSPGQKVVPLREIRDLEGFVTAVCFTTGTTEAPARLVTVCENGLQAHLLCAWDLSLSGRPSCILRHELKSSLSRAAGLASTNVSPVVKPLSGNLVFVAHERRVGIMDVDCNRLLWYASGHDARVTCLAYNHLAHTMLSGSSDCTLRMWKLGSLLCAQKPPEEAESSLFGKYKGPVSACCVACDGTRVVVAAMNKLVIQKFTPFTVIQVLHGDAGAIVSLATCPADTKLVVSAAATSMCLWDARSCMCLRVIRPTLPRKIYGLAFGPDGTMLACARDGYALDLWETSFRSELEPFTPETIEPILVQPSCPESSTCANCSSNDLVLTPATDNGTDPNLTNLDEVDGAEAARTRSSRSSIVARIMSNIRGRYL
eukprot:Rmarinus@m.15760